MAILERKRPEPKSPRRVTLAGSPAFPTPPAAEVEADEKPKKRTARKRAPKSEAKDE